MDELIELKTSEFFYSQALALIANANITGRDSEVVFKTLAYLQSVRDEISRQIEAIQEFNTGANDDA